MCTWRQAEPAEILPIQQNPVFVHEVERFEPIASFCDSAARYADAFEVAFLHSLYEVLDAVIRHFFEATYNGPRRPRENKLHRLLGSHGPAGRICITALPGVEAPGVEAPNGNAAAASAWLILMARLTSDSANDAKTKTPTNSACRLAQSSSSRKIHGASSSSSSGKKIHGASSSSSSSFSCGRN